jgi:hypothetical protein
MSDYQLINKNSGPEISYMVITALMPGGSLKSGRAKVVPGAYGNRSTYVALTRSRDALTRVPTRPRSDSSTLIKEVNPL